MKFPLKIFLFALFISSCVPPPPTSVPLVPTASVPTPAAADEIHFALIGAPQDSNVWALFDEAGAAYNDMALRAEYYPRLYTLAPPEFALRPLAAQDPPAELTPQGEFFSASVTLRPNLYWSDGAPLTAEDVAFTANAALAFELGLEWGSHYPSAFLARAEALNDGAVQFIFKQKPGAGAWQYGVLQGVIVQKKFWQPKISAAFALLPDETLKAEIAFSTTKLLTTQADVNRLSDALTVIQAAGQGSRPLEIELEQRQRELNYAQNKLDDLRETYAMRLDAAREALFALSAQNEPTLGAWRFESKTAQNWVNAANSNFPLQQPNVKRAVYHFFEDEAQAIRAYNNSEVNFILAPNGLTQTVQGATFYPTYRARFLLFNPSNPALSAPAFLQALSCLIDRSALAAGASPLENFLLSPQWRDPNSKNVCSAMSAAERKTYAADLLQQAGYSWSADSAANLILPDGAPLPTLDLLAPSEESDPLRYAAATSIAEQARALGVRMNVKALAPQDLIYAVYSSQKYDAAILGWRLSEYPAYLCQWFGGAQQDVYRGAALAAACKDFEGQTNLASAQTLARQIEAQALTEAPLIPLYVENRMEAYQGLAYPSVEIWNGWGAWYGAPLYAMPAP